MKIGEISVDVESVVRSILAMRLAGRALDDRDEAMFNLAADAIATILVLDARMRWLGPLTDDLAAIYVDAFRHRDGALRYLKLADPYKARSMN